MATDRGQLLHEGVHALASDPIAGVGPGRYVIALKDSYGATPGRHTHPGEEVGYVLEGTLLVEQDGKAPVTLKGFTTSSLTFVD